MDGGVLAAVPREGDVGGDRRDADRHRDAGVVEHRDRLRDDRRHAGRLEGEVDAVAARELANGGDGIDRGGVDRVRGAEALRPGELGGRDVDRDQALGAGDPGALERGQPDPAQADHGDACARPDLRRLQRGTDAGGDAAAQETGSGERSSVASDRLRGVHDGPRGERAERERSREWGGVPGPPNARRLDPHVRAAARDAAPARRTSRRAPPTTGRRGRRRAASRPLADLLDDAGTLVSEQHRERRAPVAVFDRPQIGVADAARREANEDLARPEVDRERLDLDRGARRVHHRSDRFSRHRSPFDRERLMLASASPMDAQTLRDRAQDRYPEFLETLEAMVNVDCGSYTPTANGSPTCANGASATHGTWSAVPRIGLGRPGDRPLRGSGGANVLLVGHMDTVFDEGTVGERPFSIDGDIARARACRT